MSASILSRDSRSRLASLLSGGRRSLVATIVGSSVFPSCGANAASAFANAFLDRLAHEIESSDASPLDLWAAGASGEIAFENARIVVVSFATVSDAYASRYGSADDVTAYLSQRSVELDAAFRVEAQPAPAARTVDPTKIVDRDDVVASLLSALEARDLATCEHSRAVGVWAGRMAKHLGMPVAEQTIATLVGTLHDVGKIATPAEVLLKAGALDDAEWETMRAHSRIGAKMLDRIPTLREFAPLVRAHHERIDGRGYPDRLEGASIPIVSRIVAVADSFHAMISKRPYRPAIPVAKALDELRRGIDTQFDATAANAMLAIVQPAGIPRVVKNVANGTL